jgi:ABC-2 type transport system permease protein
MTVAALSAPVATRRPSGGGLTSRLHDVVVLTRRNLVHIMREPLQLSDVTVQPILFTLLFVYVLGSGVAIGGGTYAQFAIAGLLLLNLTTSAMGTSVGLSTDLNTGAINRFRTLPMWSAAVLVGRTMADLLSAVVCVTMVALAGLVVGWRPEAGALSMLGGFGIALLFSYALSWACACLGIISKGPESGASVGLVVLFPLAIVSNALVPTQGMPAWLRLVANWNPVSAVASAVRHLFGNPNPSSTVHVWPMEHPVVAALAWSAVIFVVFAPLAVHLFRRRTTE